MLINLRKLNNSQFIVKGADEVNIEMKLIHASIAKKGITKRLITQTPKSTKLKNARLAQLVTMLLESKSGRTSQSGPFS